jgi:5'(3')-deoxyribonucleotidase
MLTLLIDLDSITVDLLKGWYNIYNARYNDDLTVEKTLSWNNHKFAKAGKAIYGVLDEPGFFRTLEPFPGALEGIKELYDARDENGDRAYRVLLVSAGSGNALTDKYRFVEERMPWFPVREQLVLAYPKDVMKGDVAFEDGPHNIEAYRRAWPDMRIVGVAYPYNLTELDKCDLVAGHYTNMEQAWSMFVGYVKSGAPKLYGV